MEFTPSSELATAVNLYVLKHGQLSSGRNAGLHDSQGVAVKPSCVVQSQVPGPGVTEYEAELCVAAATKLGECPLWDASRRLLCWIDIQGKRFLRHDPAGDDGNFEDFELPARPGSFCIAADGSYLFAFEDGFAFFDPETSVRVRVTDSFEPDLPTTRLNDGRVDCQGRFVCAGTAEKGEDSISAVYRLNADYSVEVLKTQVRTGNSICFDAEKGMFFADPAMVQDGVGSSSTIWRYSDYENSGMQKPEPFVECDGRPDGSIFDADGYLWNAEFGGGRVVRYRPDGSVDLIVRVPVRYTTCITFGGHDMKTLYITDASPFAHQRMSKKRREELPEGYGGGLFRVRLPIRGAEQACFRSSLEAFMRSRSA
eukprot:TRINITY_DN70697_c0_g1_i1.p1 TRINITY_DN70697_c0_g1~~TRINITY_DN70697_c0_g1_i1.p1  ORF type:complete len:369 (+),score=33.27 TRINITY_DN70697_c0_g1_i1:203-1309(+)